MLKKYKNINVYDATQDRLKFIFEEFDNILVAFSGGKDSGVLLNLVYQYAKQNNLIHKFNYYYMDYEAEYEATEEYVKETFDTIKANNKYWLCLPIKANCSVSMYEPSWIPWDKDKKDIWVKQFPNSPYLVNENNIEDKSFFKGVKGFDYRIMFGKWFASKYGKTACLIGLRADESLSRQSIFTSQQRVSFYKEKRYSTEINDNLFNFYPIYDWRFKDIWVANYKNNFNYNKIYDLYYLAGMSYKNMRVASPFNEHGIDSLSLFKALSPNTWAKMLSRVNGVNFGAIYGGTTAMGWNKITKPNHFTWEEYAKFLLNTLPENTKKIYLKKIEKSLWHWRVQGAPRSKEFILTMQDNKANIIKIGGESKSCKVNKDYEKIYIDGYLDDTTATNWKKARTWKRVCITILKNDTKCLTMGFSRTKGDNSLKKDIVAKYTNII